MESSNKKTTSVNTKNTEIKKGFIPAQLFDIDIWHFSNSLKSANMFDVYIFEQKNHSITIET